MVQTIWFDGGGVCERGGGEVTLINTKKPYFHLINLPLPSYNHPCPSTTPALLQPPLPINHPCPSKGGE